MAAAAAILILAGLATAGLAFTESAGVILCLDLVAVWMAGELLRPARRAR